MDFSFWLIPENSQKKLLEKIIIDLSNKYKSYPFIPHVTFYHFENNQNQKEIINLLEENFANANKISVEFEKLDYSNIFTKTLYCQMKTNNQLQNLYQKAKKIFLKYGDYQLNPHLSLIYKNNMKIDDKEKEIKKIMPLIPKKINFNKLALIIREKRSIKKEKDVLEWKEILNINLG